jgi:hypothetical protein
MILSIFILLQQAFYVTTCLNLLNSSNRLNRLNCSNRVLMYYITGIGERTRSHPYCMLAFSAPGVVVGQCFSHRSATTSYRFLSVCRHPHHLFPLWIHDLCIKYIYLKSAMNTPRDLRTQDGLSEETLRIPEEFLKPATSVDSNRHYISLRCLKLVCSRILSQCRRPTGGHDDSR